MDFINKTPFIPITFESRTPDDEPFQTVIVKGTFAIIAGKPLRPVCEQAPLALRDDFFAGSENSTLRYENDLAPFKPASDIIINARAHAPGGKPVPGWIISAAVGGLEKQLLVTGVRHWKHDPVRGWALTDPEPCATVPVRYELAYGGTDKKSRDNGLCAQNPIGVGYAPLSSLDTSAPAPAPRIVCPRNPSAAPDRPVKPEGFCAIPRTWQPRTGHAGAFDQTWEKERKPAPPLDFNYACYNCAHPDLIYKGFLKGDEPVVLKRLHPEHETLDFSLPGYTLTIMLTDQDDFSYGAPARLDTVHIEADQMRVFLVWRAVLPLFEDGVKKLEAKMTLPQRLTGKHAFAAGTTA